MMTHCFKRHQFLAMFVLAWSLAATGCKTFNSTDADVERERRYASDGYNNFWMRGLSLFGFSSCAPYGSGIMPSGPDLYPAASGPAGAWPWVSNAAGANSAPVGLTR